MSDEDEAGPALQRTHLAEDRTLLANERTFAGWIRTGLAAVGIGIAFNALFGTLTPLWIPKAIATTFILCGIGIFWAAERRALQVRRRLDPHEVTLMAHRTLLLIALALSLASIALIIAIWVLM